MLKTQNHDKSKTPAQPRHGPAAPSPNENSSRKHNHLWQSLALHSFGVQPKLTVSQPDGPYELEADRVADQVMRVPTAHSKSRQLNKAQRKCGPCEEEDEQNLQRKGEASNTDTPASVPGNVHETLNSPGQPLDPTTRSFMEGRFAHDFGQVRTHTDANAGEATRALRARAFTVDANIVFGHSQFAPATAEGQRLIAHELTHVIQQRPRGTDAPRERNEVHEKNRSRSVSPLSRQLISDGPHRISRVPASNAGTQSLHEELIEQYRRANGLPPHGIDPVTGQQVGPTDSEIRFGGLLEAWLLANRSPAQLVQAPGATTSPKQPAPAPAPGATTSPTQPTPAPAPGATTPPTQPAPAPAPGATVRGVPAPTKAPMIVGPGTTSVVAVCKGAPDVSACLQHRTYILNILPRAISNIRAVSSPYSAAIADLYTAALPAAQAAAAPTPFGSPNAPFGASVDAAGGPVTVTFGATTFTFTKFTISLLQQMGGANGQAFGAGGPIAFVNLNEMSNDALLSNLPGIEATMVHETMHIFMEIIEGLNRSRKAGTPMVDANLDRTSYATLKTSLENALLPFITQIRQLPSFKGKPASGSAQQNAASTADSFLSETIARAEAGIFAKQRVGQAFVAADLRALPAFFHASDYWSPTPPVLQELSNFIKTNQAQIDAAIQPIIYQVGERYLNLRP